MYQPPYYPPPAPAPSKRSQKLQTIGAAVGLILVVIVAVAVYVMLNRLDDTVLTVIATIGCAAGVSIPGLLLATVALIKRAENGNGKTAQPAMTQPTIMVVPPMQFPQLTQQTATPTPATWESIPTARHYTIVGEE